MIVLSPDAVADVERVRTFLDQVNPEAARRAMAAILTAIERLQVRREPSNDKPSAPAISRPSL
jgi:plasmid stabilization system protein ParE